MRGNWFGEGGWCVWRDGLLRACPPETPLCGDLRRPFSEVVKLSQLGILGFPSHKRLVEAWFKVVALCRQGGYAAPHPLHTVKVQLSIQPLTGLSKANWSHEIGAMRYFKPEGDMTFKAPKLW